MNNLFLIPLLTLFISFLSNGQDSELKQRIIKNDLYEVHYSENHQQPLNIKYQYPDPRFAKYAIGIQATIAQKFPVGRIYYPDVDVITITQKFTTPSGVLTSDDDDYKNNIFDKGHLVPKTPFKDTKTNHKYLWSYLNCALMHETLNRGVWRILEDYERTLNEDSLFNVNVEIVVNFSDTNNKVDGGATIPSSFTKIITYRKANWYLGNKKHIIEAYTFPNDSSVKGKKKEDYIDENLSGVIIVH